MADHSRSGQKDLKPYSPTMAHGRNIGQSPTTIYRRLTSVPQHLRSARPSEKGGGGSREIKEALKGEAMQEGGVEMSDCLIQDSTSMCNFFANAVVI
jgi:negative regulator of replication initiation